jgi:3-methyladenine DNA glycosylase AlkD
VASVDEALAMLRAHARPDQVDGMARYGISADRRLGVAVPDMRRIARTLGKDHALAGELWRTGIPEARIVAAMVAEAARLTDAEMDDWVKDFDSWDVCDQVCMNLFDQTPLAWRNAREWAGRDEEFVRRAAFALIACLAWHDKKAGDDAFIALLPVIRDGATDGRNYVKKAVSWALRHVGKRNANLNRAALATAREIQRLDSKTARWVASDAIRELESAAVQQRLAE